jgi:hypothetical protein
MNYIYIDQIPISPNTNMERPTNKYLPFNTIENSDIVWLHKQMISDSSIQNLKKRIEKKYRQWIQKQIRKKTKIGKKYNRRKSYHFRSSNSIGFNIEDKKKFAQLTDFLDTYYNDGYHCKDGQTQCDRVEIGIKLKEDCNQANLMYYCSPYGNYKQPSIFTDTDTINNNTNTSDFLQNDRIANISNINNNNTNTNNNNDDGSSDNNNNNPSNCIQNDRIANISNINNNANTNNNNDDEDHMTGSLNDIVNSRRNYYGLYAKDNIAPYTIICEYCGELTRYKDIMQESDIIDTSYNFIDLIGTVDNMCKYNYWGENKSDKLMITDLHGFLNESVYINDIRITKNSETNTIDEPNVFFIEILVNGWPHIFVVSGPNKINKGEELLIDRGMNYWEEMEQKYKVQNKIKQLITNHTEYIRVDK